MIKSQAKQLPITALCKQLNVSTSAYYVWLKRPARIISVDTLNLYRRAKALFKESRNSFGSRGVMKAFHKEGFAIERDRTRTVMQKLGLHVTQRVAYRVTTKRCHSDAVADNLLNQNFDPVAPNQIWYGDVTYLKTEQGWMYLTVVMDLYSRRIVGWHLSRRMTTDLVALAMLKAHRLRKPQKGPVFHSDRGSQYTSKQYRNLLNKLGVRASTGDVGRVGISQSSKGFSVA